MRNDAGLAPVYSVAAAVSVMSIMDALIKDMSAGFSISQIVTLRYGFGLLVALPFFLILGGSRFSTKGIRTGFYRAITIVTTASCFFYALSQLPLAVAVTIAFTAPLFMVLLAALILKEPITARALIAILIGLVGVVMIMGPDFLNGQGAKGPLLGYLTALFASLGYAMALILTRLHSSHEAPQSMVLIQTFFCCLLALPFGIGNWTSPTPIDWGQAALIGCLGTIGHFLMAWGFARAEASRLGPIEYISFLWAIVIGYFFFAETPGFWVLSGAGLIILACYVVSRRPSPRRISEPNLDRTANPGHTQP